MNRLVSHKLVIFRFSLFVVYFWFGALKVLGLSPAEEIVRALFDATLAWLLPFGVFYILFALFECLIGVLFLIPKLERAAFVLLLFHLFTTSLPLVLLPTYAWNGFMVLTLAGQYIVKNIVLFAVGLGIFLESDLQKQKSA